MARDSDPLVYSTERAQSARCERCGAQPCACEPEAGLETGLEAGLETAPVPRGTVLHVRVETKGRRGKTVTVVTDLPPHPRYFAALLTRLKAECGTGGALKPDRMELQGDQLARVRAHLERLGFTVRRSGG